MGTPYSTTSITGFNSNPPPDGGEQTAANLVTWSKHKEKLADPIKTTVESMNTKLVEALDCSASLTTTNHTVVAGDHDTVIEIADTATSGVTITLPDAATITSLFRVYVKNSSKHSQTIARTTSGDTIDEAAANISIRSKSGLLITTNSAANGYVVASSYHPRQVISVKDFGATGDNVTDDTAAIQAAINAAQGTVTRTGPVLLFEAGEYFISSGLTITGSIVIEGTGAVLRATDGFTFITIDTDSNDIYYLEINGLGFRAEIASGFGVSEFPAAILVSGSNTLFRSSFRRIHSRGNSTGFVFTDSGAQIITIQDCLFDNFGGNGHVIGILTENATGNLGISRIVNNTIIVGQSGGSGIFIEGPGIGDMIISGNQIEGVNSLDFGIQLDATDSPVYGARFQVVGNKMDTVSVPIRIKNIKESSFIGNGFAGSTNMTVEGTESTGNAFDNARSGQGSGFTQSFTGTLTGCTTSPTGTIRYVRNGNSVMLHIPTIEGTSNTTAATITGLPADLIPELDQMVLSRAINNSAVVLSATKIGTNGVITLTASVGEGAFTGSGGKGTAVCTISYLIAD